MTVLTTRQRDLLTSLIRAESPKGVEDLAGDLNLTPREVNYGLKGIKQWLLDSNVEIEVKSGIGITLNCTEEQSRALLRDLESVNFLQLILSAEERQQLLALFLLVVDEPLHVQDLEELIQVSKTTVIKDLDIIETWYNDHQTTITRRPNYGIEVEAHEDLRQKLITMLLWGESPFGRSLVQINYTDGLIFSLQKDAELHPLVLKSKEILSGWNLKRVFGQIAHAEAQLGSRFTDDSFLHLALVFAIQTDRISKGHHLDLSNGQIQELKTLPAWRVAKGVANRLGWNLRPEWRDIDIAGIAIWLLAAPRNENLPGDMKLDESFEGLVDAIMLEIADAYKMSEMSSDLTLRDGLTNHIIPACLRQKYDIWKPFPYDDFSLSDKYAFEIKIAKQMAALIEAKTTFRMPDVEINNIAALLRAACIRLQPRYFQQVLVVCPGGMASAQLLMSRLGARFPHLGALKVVSIRELTDEIIKSADLMITTVPIAEDISKRITVLQVHPLLLAEDVEAITQLMK